MNYQITVLRQADRKSCPYTQTISYTCDDPQMSIATLLKSMNADDSIRDVEGKPVGEIRYECSCLQKKCGACAMRINGRPRLACDAKLGEFKNGRILLEPLKKFPVIADLIVDRALMMENLKSICLWLNNEARHTRQGDEIAYEASRCLQCGCCLEVCPNFIPGEEFCRDRYRFSFSKQQRRRRLETVHKMTDTRDGCLSFFVVEISCALFVKYISAVIEMLDYKPVHHL